MTETDRELVERLDVNDDELLPIDLVYRVAIAISGAPFATHKSRKKAIAAIFIVRAAVAAEIREAAKTSPYAEGRTQEFIYGLQDGYEAAAQIAGKEEKPPAVLRLLSIADRAAAMQWRPIEIAPKDETHFLGIHWPEGSEGSPFPNAICWNPWIGDFSKDAGPDAKPVLFQPTHWMPLPAPPEGEKP